MKNLRPNSYLKSLEKVYHETLKSNDYSEKYSKANKNLDPSDFRIKHHHTLSEYFAKYGKKIISGKALALKKDELWLMNKHDEYWEIHNSSDFLYFKVPHINKKPFKRAAISLLAAGVVAGGIAACVIFANKGNSNELPPINFPEIGKPLNEYTWEEISKISQSGKARDYFNIGDTKYIQLKHQGEIGASEEDTIILDDEDGSSGDGILDKDNSGGYTDGDEVYQTVRILDFYHDELERGNKGSFALTGGITFQFVNSICDSVGHSLGCVWNDRNNRANYLNVTLQMLLNEETQLDSSIGWYQRGATQRSKNEGMNKSVYGMLPTYLSTYVNSVFKDTGYYDGYSWSTTILPQKIFLLSYREMTTSYESNQLDEGETYAYWIQHTSNSDRVVKQIRRTDTYTNTPRITDGSQNIMDNYAGYCSAASSTGQYTWIRSPITSGINKVWQISTDGGLLNGGLNIVYRIATSIVPAFCV